MNERAEIFLLDEEGILIRAYMEESLYFHDGEPDDEESPLMDALGNFYVEHAPATILCEGFETPGGMLLWESEMVSPSGEEGFVEIGERLFLVDDKGERFMDENAYEYLSRGEIPLGWVLKPRYK